MYLGRREDEHLACIGCLTTYIKTKVSDKSIKAFPMSCFQVGLSSWSLIRDSDWSRVSFWQCTYEITDEDATRIFGPENLEGWVSSYLSLLILSPRRNTQWSSLDSIVFPKTRRFATCYFLSESIVLGSIRSWLRHGGSSSSLVSCLSQDDLCRLWSGLAFGWARFFQAIYEILELKNLSQVTLAINSK